MIHRQTIVRSRSDFRTIVLNKPYGVLPCFTDPEGRPTLADYVKMSDVYAAGRLDRDSEGLMVLTSDGRLAHIITDPQHQLSKVYLVQVERMPNSVALEQLRRGVILSGRRTRPAEVRLLAEEPKLAERPVPIRFRKNVPTAWLEIVLREGLNRQVRRMTAAVGHPTLRLVRTAIGPMTLSDLEPGQWRPASQDEILLLFEQARRGRMVGASGKPNRRV
jgi:23S rRNA pseudouridine2457 synthase